MIEPRQAYVLKLLPPANDTCPAGLAKARKTISTLISSLELMTSVWAIGRFKRLEKL